MKTYYFLIFLILNSCIEDISPIQDTIRPEYYENSFEQLGINGSKITLTQGILNQKIFEGELQEVIVLDDDAKIINFSTKHGQKSVTVFTNGKLWTSCTELFGRI